MSSQDSTAGGGLEDVLKAAPRSMAEETILLTGVILLAAVTGLRRFRRRI